MALTFGLFLHRVESHIAVAPNNVRGKDLGAACLCLLLLCRAEICDSYHGNKSTTPSIHKVSLREHPPFFFAALSDFPAYA